MLISELNQNKQIQDVRDILSKSYLNRNSYIFIQESAFENVLRKMMAILPRPLCV